MRIADLPEDQRLRIGKLVETLNQRTKQRNHYKELYQQALQKIQKMEDELESAKASKNAIFNQFKNSFAAINRVRSSAQKISRSQKHIKNQQDWQDVENQNSSMLMNQKASQSNQKNKALINVLKPPLLSTSKKQMMSGICLNQSQFQSSSKKKQIESLKKQLNELRSQIKTKQIVTAPMSQKMRKCEQIKKRYLKKNITEEHIQTPQKINSSQISKLKSQLSDDDHGSVDKSLQQCDQHKNVVKVNKLPKPQYHQKAISKAQQREKSERKLRQAKEKAEDSFHISPKKLPINQIPIVTKKAGRTNNLYQDSLFDLIAQLDN